MSESHERTADLDPDEPVRGTDKQETLLSPASQIGRAAQTGGTPASGIDPDEESREGWEMPDQTDTPEEWPQPTADN